MVSINGTGKVSNGDYGFGIYKQPDKGAQKVDVSFKTTESAGISKTGNMEEFLAFKGQQIRESLGLSIPKNDNVSEATQIVAASDYKKDVATEINTFITNAPYERIEQQTASIGAVINDIGVQGNTEALFASKLSVLDKAFGIS